LFATVPIEVIGQVAPITRTIETPAWLSSLAGSINRQVWPHSPRRYTTCSDNFLNGVRTSISCIIIKPHHYAVYAYNRPVYVVKPDGRYRLLIQQEGSAT
jgi:hypothetical protein